jgi:hypothetical protein
MDGESPPVALASPDADPMANPVNGHEWNNTDASDLQYSCIFPLPASRDCDSFQNDNPRPGCDCTSGSDGEKSPLCQSSSGDYSSVQRYAKAYPSIRELQVAQALGGRGLTASICAKNLLDPNQNDFGYRPAIDALINQVKASIGK